MALSLIGCASNELQNGQGTVAIDSLDRTVTFTGTIYPSQFNSWRSWPQNHHFIVWQGGRSSNNALIEADASDLDVGRALRSLGAVAGDNLTLDSWDARQEPGNSDPDLHVEGTVVDVVISWGDSASVRAGDILVDHGGKGFEFRFGGHEKFVPVWKSGCIVCLESCPGGRISNARYTLRDYQYDVATFDPRHHMLPEDGTPVVVTLKVMGEP